jgi:hypothetical protein
MGTMQKRKLHQHAIFVYFWNFHDIPGLTPLLPASHLSVLISLPIGYDPGIKKKIFQDFFSCSTSLLGVLLVVVARNPDIIHS